MTFPEIALLLVTTVLLLRVVVAPSLVPEGTARALLLTSGVLLILHLAVGGPRWQLIPVYLILTVLSLVLLKRTRSHLLLRVLGASICGVLIMASAFLAQGFPVLQLPAPDGPYAVGTFSSALTDNSRVETFDPPARRELAVEVWYPATADKGRDAHPLQPLWSELYAGPIDWVSFFTGYLGHVQTHSSVGAPIAQSATPFPVLLYDSGLGWTSQNTLLMEHLASHGYVVVSVSHPYDQLKVHLPGAGSILIDLAGDQSEKAEFTAVMYRTFQQVWFEMARAPNRPQRSQLASDYLSLCDAVAGLTDPAQRRALIGRKLQAPNVSPIERRNGVANLDVFCRVLVGSKNRAIARDVADTAFVADQLPSIQAPIRGFSSSLDLRRMGVFGHSDGGAIAGEFCKTDGRCKAGLNMDGAQFGAHWKEPAQAPFAMLYSAGQEGLNDFAFPKGRFDHFEYDVAGAGHADFLDIGLVAPVLKQLAQGPQSFGPILAGQMNAITNWTVLTFFDHYLKGEVADLSPPARFPELTLSPAESSATRSGPRR